MFDLIKFYGKGIRRAWQAHGDLSFFNIVFSFMEERHSGANVYVSDNHVIAHMEPFGVCGKTRDGSLAIFITKAVNDSPHRDVIVAMLGHLLVEKQNSTWLQGLFFNARYQRRADALVGVEYGKDAVVKALEWMAEKEPLLSGVLNKRIHSLTGSNKGGMVSC